MGIVNIRKEVQNMSRVDRSKPLACSSGVIVTIGGKKYRKHYGHRVYDKQTGNWLWGIPPSYWDV